MGWNLLSGLTYEISLIPEHLIHMVSISGLIPKLLISLMSKNTSKKYIFKMDFKNKGEGGKVLHDPVSLTRPQPSANTP